MKSKKSKTAAGIVAGIATPAGFKPAKSLETRSCPAVNYGDVRPPTVVENLRKGAEPAGR